MLYNRPITLLLLTLIPLHAEITEESVPQEAADDDIVQLEPMELIFAPKQTDYYRKKNYLEQQFARDLPSPEVARKEYKQNKKQRKNNNNQKKTPFWSSVTISDMNYDQLLQRKNELIASGDYTMAANYLERLFKVAESPEQIIYIMLEWAELLMHNKDYKKAETLLRDFIKLYPSNEYVERAFVKAIESSWYQTLPFDRDQSKTEETLALSEEFDTRKTIYGQESVDRVSHISMKCHDKLAQSCIHIAKNDIVLARYKEVRKRIEDLRENTLKILSGIEPQLLQLEIELAQAEQKTDLEQLKLSELKEKFPEHEITLALTTKKKSWFARA